MIIDSFLFKVFRNSVNERAFPVVKTSGAQRIFFTGNNENELVRTHRNNNHIQTTRNFKTPFMLSVQRRIFKPYTSEDNIRIKCYYQKSLIIYGQLECCSASPSLFLIKIILLLIKIVPLQLKYEF